MKFIFLFAIPRSGTNLFSAMLHNHERIYALAHGGTKRLLQAGHRELKRVIHTKEGFAEWRSAWSIYSEGGQKKFIDRIQYLLLDKVHWNPGDKLALVQRAGRAINHQGHYGIALLRNPFAVMFSRKRFDEKWGRTAWAITEENVAALMRNEFMPLLEQIPQTRTLTIPLEGFIQYPQAYYQYLCAELGLAYDPIYTSFHETFERYGCACGGRFSVKPSAEYTSTYLHKVEAEIEPTDHFYCETCGEPTIGYGRFNPYQKLNPLRVAAWQEAILPEDADLIRKVMRHWVGEDVTAYFEHNTDWSLPRFQAAIAEFDIKASPLRQLRRILRRFAQ